MTTVREPGLALLRMRSPSRMQRWKARRLDEVAFLDYATAQRRVKLDVNLAGVAPKDLPVQDGTGSCRLLACRARRTRRAPFKTRPAALPRLKWPRNGRWRARAPRGPPPALLGSDNHYGRDRRGPARRAPSREVRRQRPGQRAQRITGNFGFLDLLNELRRSFHLVAVVPEENPTRCVLSYASWSSRGSVSPSPTQAACSLARVDRCAERSLAAGRRLRPVRGRDAGAAASYHIELTAPYDIELHEGAFAGRRRPRRRTVDSRTSYRLIQQGPDPDCRRRITVVDTESTWCPGTVRVRDGHLVVYTGVTGRPAVVRAGGSGS